MRGNDGLYAGMMVRGKTQLQMVYFAHQHTSVIYLFKWCHLSVFLIQPSHFLLLGCQRIFVFVPPLSPFLLVVVEVHPCNANECFSNERIENIFGSWFEAKSC